MTQRKQSAAEQREKERWDNLQPHQTPHMVARVTLSTHDGKPAGWGILLNP